MPRCYSVIAMLLASLLAAPSVRGDEVPARRVRVATFNVSLNRPEAGRLIRDLESGLDAQARKIAEIIQRVRPDILLLNEFDHDPQGLAAAHFQTRYLAIAQGTQSPIRYADRFAAAVNTGVPSGYDLDRDRATDGPGDAFGFGAFPGQYGMLVLSQFPINRQHVRTFQEFLWREMPNALLPRTADGPFYQEAELAILRLSSKSHWDLPITIRGSTLHFLCAHPTPPVFDGPEDRNGRRNHDEIRFWADYVVRDRSGYIVDDHGHRGGLAGDTHFIIAGDMNADPHDGDSVDNAIHQLLADPRINGRITPTSRGAVAKSAQDGGANRRQLGDPARDTADFNDRNVGNLRLDYVLPDNSLRVLDAGVFWPAEGEPGHELVDASDHRLTWIDIEL